MNTDVDPQFQTRSERTGLRLFNTLKEAHAAALEDPSIWKISYTTDLGRRIRLVKNDQDGWDDAGAIPLLIEEMGNKSE